MRPRSRLTLSWLVLTGLAGANPQAGPTFTEMNVGLGTLTVSKVNWGDYDNDGDLDLAFQGWESGARFTRIYRNTGGLFAHETAAVLEPYNEGPLVFGDYDNDGDLDLLAAGWGGGGTGTRIHRNDGGGAFFWITSRPRGVKGADGAWGDTDNDGDLDIVIAGESFDPPQADYAQIYRNAGNDQFALAANLTGLYEGKVALGDYDNDGNLDLALAGRTVGSTIFRNDGGTFTDIGAGLPPLMYTGLAWGDYDNDGDLDLALFGGDGSVATFFDVFRNDAGTFVALNAGLPAIHFGELDWGDYDNDGDPDLLVTGLDATGTPLARVYRNNAGLFADAGLGLVAMANTVTGAWGDYDNDGDLDIVFAGHDLSGVSVRVYRNNSAVANTAPAAPIAASPVLSGNDVTFSWTASIDAETPAAGLTYNLRVGTTPGAQQIMAPMADLGTGLRRLPARGNAEHNLSWKLKNLPSGTYYYSVQAIDGAFKASSWSAEQAIVVPPGPRVSAMTPAPGGTIPSAPSMIALTLTAAPDPASVTSSSVTLVHSGGDLTLGTADDLVVTPSALTISGNQIQFGLSGVTLPNGPYRVTLQGTEPAIPNNTNWWKLDDGGGSTTAADSAGTAPGTLGTGGTSPTWTTGRLGGGLSFAGADNRVAMAAADLPIPWTATMWVNRADSAASDARLMDSATSSLRLEQYNDTNLLGITAGGVFDAAFAYSAPPGQWIHVTFVCESDGTSLSLNGVFLQKIAPTMGCPRACLGSIGFNAMVGVLDDVRLFNRKLTQAEITAVAGLGGVLRSGMGAALDGEFSGTFPSGNGTNGGNFTADFTLSTPLLRVAAMTPAPGATLASPPASISITTNGPFDPATVSFPAVGVARAGFDGVLGTGDDVFIVPTSVTPSGGNTIQIGLPGGLPSDQYRVILSASEISLPGIVNHWKLDEATGSTAADSIGASPGTLGGAGGTSPLWRSGRSGAALGFNGFQDRVFIGATTVGAPFTAALWVWREDSVVEDARLLDSTAHSLRLEQFNHTGRTGVTVYGSVDTAYGYAAPVGQWIHLTFVGETNGTSLYVNGVFSEKVGTVIGCPRTQLGSGGYNSMVGLLDDVRIFNRVLLPDEVQNVASLGAAVRNPAGNRLDGEFSGTFPSGNGVAGGNFVASFTVSSGGPPPAPFILSSPGTGATNVMETPTYSWTASAGAATYTLQIATDLGFGTLVVNQAGIAATSFTPAVTLANSTSYFWRVAAVNANGTTLATGSPSSFATRAAPPPVVNIKVSGCGGLGLEMLLPWAAFLALRRRVSLTRRSARH